MDAERLLRKLGASGRLKGFRYAAYMMERIAEDSTAIYLITKTLYPETAKHFRGSICSVERGLRTVISVCWRQGDRDFMETVAGRPLREIPTNSEFLDMTADYLRRQRAAAE